MNEEQASHFFSLFQGNNSAEHYVHGENDTPKGWYQTEKRSLTLEDVQRHLRGEEPSLLSIPILPTGNCHFADADIDCHTDSDTPVDHPALARKITELQLPLIVTRSRRSGGAHLTLFFKEPDGCPAIDAQRLVAHYLQMLGLQGEIFPKQDDGPEKLGSGINLPYFGSERVAFGQNGEELNLAGFLALVVKRQYYGSLLVSRLPQSEPSAAAPISKNTKDHKKFSPYEVRRIYKDQLEKLRKAPFGDGNVELNNTALVASRVCASKVLEKTEQQFKDEIFGIVTKEWKSPHDEEGARGTIKSGWRKGASEGSYNLRDHVTAVSSNEYCAEAPREIPYIVQGMIYEATASQLMGPIKAGKTTWLFAMIRSMLAGEDFIGQKTKPTNVLYVTEQPRHSFQAQLGKSALDRSILLENRLATLYVLDLGQLWNLNWSDRADTIRENADRLKAGLVIIDTFPRIALVEEIQNAGEMNRCFEEINPLVVADNRAVLLGWHERKAGGSIFEAAAGTAASGGAVDMLLRLQRAPGSPLNDRVRQLEISGRMPAAFEETATIMLNNEMSNYSYVGTKKAAVRKNVEQQILGLVPRVSPGMTFEEILKTMAGEAQEEGFKPPSESTVERAVKKLEEDGLLQRTGKGGREDPYRYHGKEARENF